MTSRIPPQKHKLSYALQQESRTCGQHPSDPYRPSTRERAKASHRRRADHPWRLPRLRRAQMRTESHRPARGYSLLGKVRARALQAHLRLEAAHLPRSSRCSDRQALLGEHQGKCLDFLLYRYAHSLRHRHSFSHDGSGVSLLPGSIIRDRSLCRYLCPLCSPCRRTQEGLTHGSDSPSTPSPWREQSHGSPSPLRIPRRAR